MIKINIEYTIIGTNIFEVNPIITKDVSTTTMELIMADSIKIIAEECMKAQKEKSLTNEILKNIGK